jgi:phage anti-repressor protein
MNELIQNNYENEKPTVSGRELHAFLEVETPYHKWFPRMCEYGFAEGKSYWTFLSDRSDGLPGKQPTDHALTISMAKEICMLQRSSKGKECREYFIVCEEAWNSPEKIMERAWEIAHRRAVEAERRIFGLLEKNEILEIALNESLQYYTVAKYNKTFHMGWNMAKCQEIGKRLSAYCCSHAIEIRKCETNDERFGTVNSYPITAWNDLLERMSHENAFG